MSVKKMAEVWDHDFGSHTRKLVMLAIADHADDSGRAWPSIPRISKKCNLNRATTIRKLNELQENGCLIVEKKGGRTSLYIIRLVAACDPSQRATRRRELHEPVAACNKPVAACDPNHHNHQITTKEEKPPRRKKANFDPSTMDLPFASAEFAQAWQDWCDHRQEIRKPITPTMAKQQLKQFATIGEKRAIAGIDHTIAKGWQGFREADEAATKNTDKPQYTY